MLFRNGAAVYIPQTPAGEPAEISIDITRSGSLTAGEGLFKASL